MKKIFTKCIPSIIFAFVLMLCNIGVIDFSIQKKGVDAQGEQPQTYYTTMDHFKYQLTNKLTLSPDTMEAWLKMPQNSVGGTIMGNYTHTEMQYKGIVDWKVDAIGRVCIEWNNKQFCHTFKNHSINDNVWHHVAVVRNPETHVFTLYVDGEFKDSVKCVQGDLTDSEIPMTIGVDSSYSTSPSVKKVKEPFEGYIRQVTLYNGAITQQRVQEDMNNAIITDSYNGQILGNWYLGDVWTERTVKDSTSNNNDAFLATFDRYVGVANQDFEFDYSFVVIPDVQTTVRHHKDKYVKSMQYLAENKEELKIQFAMQVGDLSDSGSVERYFADAAEGLSYLDNVIPYSFVPGNHDYNGSCHEDRDLTYYNKHFPYSKHSTLPGFAGAYEEGAMENTYYLYEVGSVKYCVINLEVAPRRSVIRWAGKICERYPEHRVIINTHVYMENSGDIIRDYSACSAALYNWRFFVDVTSPKYLYDNLISKYENIFMVFCGHVAADDALVRYDVGKNGNTITSMLINLQASLYDSGLGEDPVFIIKVNESRKVMSCYYYSAAHDAVYNLQNQFEIPLYA